VKRTLKDRNEKDKPSSKHHRAPGNGAPRPPDEPRRPPHVLDDSPSVPRVTEERRRTAARRPPGGDPRGTAAKGGFAQ